MFVSACAHRDPRQVKAVVEPQSETLVQSLASSHQRPNALMSANVNRLDHAIISAAQVLRNSILPSGQFVYRHKLSQGLEISGSYNIVRHAGAIYSLVMFESDFPSPENRAAIANTSRFLISSSMRPVESESGKHLAAIFSMPELTHKDKLFEASLGGSALGLVALLGAEKVDAKTISLEQLRSLARFIVSMQLPNGSFYSKYIPGQGRDEKFQSLYYPGEAILSLIMMYQRDPDPAWLSAALSGMRYLALVRKAALDVPSDNWALVATEELVRSGQLAESDRAVFMQHALQVARRNTGDQIHDTNSALYGCFTADGRTTPTATHLEGLLAAATYLPANLMTGDQADQIMTSIDSGIQFLLDSQQTSGPYEGAIPMANLNALAKLQKEPIKNASVVRIDYVQHALSAFLRYRHIASSYPSPK
jgi:hypothetical protein